MRVHTYCVQDLQWMSIQDLPQETEDGMTSLGEKIWRQRALLVSCHRNIG